MEIDSQITRPKYIQLMGSLIIKGWSFYVTIVVFLVAIVLRATTEIDVTAMFVCVITVFLYYLISILYMGFSPMNRNFFLPVKYFFTEEEVQVISPISREILKWDIFIKWRSTPGYYLIYVSGTNFLAIPKSAISAQDVSTFKRLLADRIKTSPKTWTGLSIGLLITSVIFVLAWLFSIYMASQVGNSILTDSSTIAIGLTMLSLPLLLAFEFIILIHNKKTDSKKRNNILLTSILLTNAAILVILLDLYIFKQFMYPF